MRQRKSKPVEAPPYTLTEDEARIVAWLDMAAKDMDALADKAGIEVSAIRLATMAAGIERAVRCIRNGEHRR